MGATMADCRCGGRIFERPVVENRTEWAHVDPYDRHRTQLCQDGESARPVPGTENTPKPMFAR